MATNKKVLAKGIKFMGWALPLIFMGPTVIHSSFKNQDNQFFIPVLGIGILMCLFAIILMFRGISTIMKSLFDGEQK